MSQLNSIFALLSNLQDPERTVTKLRFALPDSPALEGEIQLTPMVAFQGSSLAIGFKSDEETNLLVSARYNVSEDWLSALDDIPILQEGGYYYLTPAQLIFMCSYFATSQAVYSGCNLALTPILKQVSKVSITVDTEVVSNTDLCPMYVTYTVTDAEIEAAAAKLSGVLEAVPIPAV